MFVHDAHLCALAVATMGHWAFLMAQGCLLCLPCACLVLRAVMCLLLAPKQHAKCRVACSRDARQVAPSGSASRVQASTARHQACR